METSLQLLSADASPFARKIRVQILETGLEDRVEIVAVATTPTNTAPSVAAANPLGKIPALIRADAPSLYDSRVISRFLDTQAQSDLYPEARLWEVLTLEATADAIMDAAVLMVYENRIRPEALVYQDWIEAQWSKISRALDAVATRWMSHLNGPLDMAQISLACALSYLDFRHGARNWRDDHGDLAAWHESFSARAAMIATAPV